MPVDPIGTVVANARWVASGAGEWHRRDGAGSRKPKTVWARTSCGQEGFWKHDAEVPPPGAQVCDQCARPVLAVLTATGYGAAEVMGVLAAECGERRPVNVAVIPAPPDFGGTVLEWQGLMQDLAADVLITDEKPPAGRAVCEECGADWQPARDGTCATCRVEGANAVQRDG